MKTKFNERIDYLSSEWINKIMNEPLMINNRNFFSERQMIEKMNELRIECCLKSFFSYNTN